MKTNTTTPDYKGYRFPPAIISHAVWLYFRFSLSFRDIEERTTHTSSVISGMEEGSAAPGSEEGVLSTYKKFLMSFPH